MTPKTQFQMWMEVDLEKPYDWLFFSANKKDVITNVGFASQVTKDEIDKAVYAFKKRYPKEYKYLLLARTPSTKEFFAANEVLIQECLKQAAFK